MKQLISLLSICIVVFCSSCKNNVERSKEYIDKHFDEEMMDTVNFIASSMTFYLYAVESNYWYQEGTSWQKIVDDKFEYGIELLDVLKSRATDIQTQNDTIKDAVHILTVFIKDVKSKLLKEQKNIEVIDNSFFGLGLFGGASSLAEFASALGFKDKNHTDQLPKEIHGSFEYLSDLLDYEYKVKIPESIDHFIQKSVDNKTLKPEERRVIFKYFCLKLQNSLLQTVSAEKKEDVMKIMAILK